MTSQEPGSIIAIARRAPLQNMAEAEAVAQLLQKLAERHHFLQRVDLRGASNALVCGERSAHRQAPQAALIRDVFEQAMLASACTRTLTFPFATKAD